MTQTECSSKHWSIYFAAALCAMIFGCGPSDPHDAHFKGTWKHTVEDSIGNKKDSEIIDVIADHDRFRTELKLVGGGSSIDIFDGKMLYHKSVYVPVDAAGQPLQGDALAAAGAQTPYETAKAATPTETGSQRFWSLVDTPGHGEPGGSIAGRDTVLYKAHDHRPDGDISEQQWLDAKTGVLMKRMMSIYSSQVNSMVRQEEWECQSIDYAPVDESAFNKP